MNKSNKRGKNKINKKRETRFSVFLVIILVLIFGVAFAVFANKSKNDTENDIEEIYIPKLKVQKLEKGVLEKTVNFSAVTKPVKEVEVFPEASGKLLNVYVKEGDYVQRGQLLANLEADKSLMANLQLAQTSLEVAEEGAEATEKLYKQLKKDADGTDSEKSAKRQYDLSVDAAEGQVDVASEQVDYIKAQLSKYSLRAPSNGVINNMHLDMGDTITPVVSFGTIITDNKITIKSGVSETEVKNIELGQVAKIMLVSNEDEFFEGKVVSVGIVPDEASKKFPVEIELENLGGDLSAGVVAHVSIIVEKNEDVLVVPNAAIFSVEGKDFIYVLEEDQFVVSRELEIEKIDNEKSLILSGLSEGDIFVENAKYDLEEGAQVEAFTE